MNERQPDSGQWTVDVTDHNGRAPRSPLCGWTKPSLTEISGVLVSISPFHRWEQSTLAMLPRSCFQKVVPAQHCAYTPDHTTHRKSHRIKRGSIQGGSALVCHPPLLKAPQPVSKSPWPQDGPLTLHTVLEQVGPVFTRPDAGRRRKTPPGGSTLTCGRKKCPIPFLCFLGFFF